VAKQDEKGRISVHFEVFRESETAASVPGTPHLQALNRQAYTHQTIVAQDELHYL